MTVGFWVTPEAETMHLACIDKRLCSFLIRAQVRTKWRVRSDMVMPAKEMYSHGVMHTHLRMNLHICTALLLD